MNGEEAGLAGVGDGRGQGRCPRSSNFQPPGG